MTDVNPILVRQDIPPYTIKSRTVIPSTYTIAGSGFGTKSHQGCEWHNNFESASAGAFAEDIGYNVGITGAVSVVDNFSHSGTKSLHYLYASGNKFPKVNRDVANPTNELMYSAWFYWDKAESTNGVGVFKLFRCGSGEAYSGSPKFYHTAVSDSGYPNNNAGAINSVDAGMRVGGAYPYTFNDNNSIGIPTRPWPPAKDGWNYIEYFNKYSTTPTSGDGRFVCKINGQVFVSIVNKNTRGAGEESALITSWIGMINGRDGIVDPINVWVDEEVVDNCFNRVIITDNANYSLSTKWSRQPVHYWSDGEVKAIRKRGMFNVGESAYAHVFNAADTLVYSTPITVLAD